MDTSKKYLINILMSLAKSDDDFDEREKRVIERIAYSNGLSEKETEVLLSAEVKPIQNLKKLDYEEKFEILYHLIALMKADNQVVNTEVIFIQKITENLGFQLAAIMEMYPFVHVNFAKPADISKVKKRIKENFLITSSSS